MLCLELTVIVTLILLFFLGKLLYRVFGHFFWVPDWKSKSVIITGCDSGFGFYTALKLADFGVRVFAGCLSSDGEEKVRSFRPNCAHLHPIRLNITSDISVEEAVKFVEQILGEEKLWALINNAGISLITGPDDLMSLQHYKQHMEVNFLGHRRMTQAFKPLIKKSRGRILFMTSIQGRLALPETAPYNASKWATEAYADSLRRELRDFGVRVLVIEPGGFRTNLNLTGAKNFENLWNSLPEERKAEYGEKYFQDRLARMTDVPKYQSTDMDLVPDTMIEAVFSKFWRYRYVVGNRDLRLVVSMLPEWIQDAYIMSKSLNLEKPAVVLEKKLKHA